MAFSNGIKLLEECRISPLPCPFSKISIPLTFFDIGFLPLPPVQRLFFYQFDCSKTSFADTILPNLKNSLSITLNHFFPMAGNLTWPLDSIKPEILYLAGDSVSLTVCESDHDFCQLVGNQVRNANKVFLPFTPQLLNLNVSSEKKGVSVLALQVTLFPNQGICVGITYHHAIVDGNAFFQFVKSWACVSRLQGDTSFLAKTPLCYDKSIVKDPKGLGMKNLEEFKKLGIFTKEAFDQPRNHHATPTAEKVLTTLVLRQSEIKRLKSWFTEEKGIGGLSTFVITSAYVWVCWIQARRNEDTIDDDGMEGFLTPVDCRERFDPPLPQTYFGNCLLGAMAKVKTSDLVGKDGIVIAAEAIRDSIKTPTEGNEQMLEYMETTFSVLSSFGPGRILSVTGSPRFGAYDVDFGWGSPKTAHVVSSVNAGVACFTECPTETGAIQISLPLKPIEVEAFASFFANTIRGFP